MSEDLRPASHCSDCGARYATLDDDGMCQACFVVRGLHTGAELQQAAPPEEPHRERVTGQRLAAALTRGAAGMTETERILLGIECHFILGEKCDPETCPELCAAINALLRPVGDDVRASKWN